MGISLALLLVAVMAAVTTSILHLDDSKPRPDPLIGSGSRYYSIYEECLNGVTHYVAITNNQVVSMVRGGDVHGNGIPCTVK